MSTIESVLNETRLFPPSPQFVQNANVSGMVAYQALCDEAQADYAGFWARLAREHVLWHKPFQHALDESNAPFFKWFHDGELNVSYNCLDRHLKSQPNKVAIIFEADDGSVTKVTYRQLYHRVCQFANGLKALGIKTGDRVILYLPMSIEAVVAMQACARIGATHSVVFGGFSAKSLQERIVDAGAVAVITADGQMRGGREIPLKPAVDEAFAMGGCDAVRNVVIYKRTGSEIPVHAPRDVWWDDVVRDQADVCEPDWVECRAPAVHPLHLRLHRQTQRRAARERRVHPACDAHNAVDLRLQADRRVLVYRGRGLGDGPHLHRLRAARGGRHRNRVRGRAHLPRCRPLLEDDRRPQSVACSTPLPPQFARSSKPAQISPGNTISRAFGCSGPSGEPINPEAWMWYHTTVGAGRCPIVDTWWQTETGGHMITPLPGVVALKPGSCTLPLPGIIADVVDETGHPVEKGKGGILVIKRPWPAMIRTIWGDPERFKKSYYPDDFKGKYYLAGDGANRDLDGYFWIMGRIDDVLNVSGHRLGTMEIESALVANTLVAEAAVVGKPHDIKGEAIVAFVVLKGSRPEGAAAQEIAQKLRDWVGQEIGPIAKPDDIRFGENLPKTRSGKIMRRLLRSLAKGETITQDVSTLENPAILEQLKTAAR